MTAEFRCTEADYLSARWAWLRHHPLKLALWLWYPLVILIVVVLGSKEHPGNWPIYLLFFLLAVVLVAVVALTQKWAWRRQFKKTPLWHDNISAMIDAESIKLTAPTFEAIHNWGEFSDVYESERVVIFEKGTRFIFLPKNGMGHLQLEEMRAIISTNARCKVKLASSRA